jgi:hypothetical protein
MDQFWRKRRRRPLGSWLDGLSHPVVGWSVAVLGTIALLGGLFLLGASMLPR